MTWFLIKMLIRVVLFGVALGYVMRNSENITVKPRKALPLVALVFAVLNAVGYWLLKVSISLVSLFTLSLVAPFIANALLLLATTRLVKQFKIDGVLPLAYASLVMTIAHFVLHLVRL
jgi:uncharacterized membrane protein YvlD (DUF360 family)